MNQDEHSRDDDVRRIEQQAAEWLVKSDRLLAAAEQDRFFQWLAADPRHSESLARYRETWQEFAQLAHHRPEPDGEPNPDLFARSGRSSAWAWRGAVAAAACAAIVMLAWRTDRSPERAGRPPASAPGQTHRVLDDGSVVELDRDAVIDVRYTPTERRVSLLAGEASFTVAKNKQRPFIVRAGGVDVRAVGTVFDVRLDAARVEVLVSEGRVRVSPPAPPAPRSEDRATLRPPADLPVLVAGQRAVVSLLPGAPPPIVAEVTPDEMGRLLAWQPRLLDFTSAPLASVVAEFNRHSRTRVVIGDPEIARISIDATFRSDNIDGFLRLLDLSVGIQARRLPDGDIELRRSR